MTHPLPPDPAQFPTVLAPPRRYRLAVCLRDTTALSPSLSILAGMLVSLAQGIFLQAAFPEAVLAPGHRWCFPSGAAADPAPCGEETPGAQRSPPGVGRATAEPAPTGAQPVVAATPQAQR